MITDYKYRKARKMVKDAKVGQGVKNMFFCALKQYKNGIEPATELYQEADGTVTKKKNPRACLVGAALADKLGFGGNDGYDDEFRNGLHNYRWEDRAVKEFKVKPEAVSAIITGFDATHGCVNRNSRIQVLADNIAVFLGAKDANIVDDEDDDTY